MTRPAMGLLRRLSGWCVHAAGRLLPPAGAEWAQAMEAEVAAIADDREALRWAVGCLLTSHAVQLRRQLHRPSAYLPLIMSLIAIAMVLIHAAMYGIVHETDEGTPAHIFQLLMVVQVPIIGFFALRWFQEAPASAMQILIFQFGAMCCAVVAVLLLT